VQACRAVRRAQARAPRHSAPYLRYVFPLSPLYLPSIPPLSPLYRRLVQRATRTAQCAAHLGQGQAADGPAHRCDREVRREVRRAAGHAATRSSVTSSVQAGQTAGRRRLLAPCFAGTGLLR
jgi:hypothetical protein